MTEEIQVYFTNGAWHWRRVNLLTAEELSHSASTFTSAVLARANAAAAHPSLTITPFFVDTTRYPAGW